jgi:hypothetical protein
VSLRVKVVTLSLSRCHRCLWVFSPVRLEVPVPLLVPADQPHDRRYTSCYLPASSGRSGCYCLRFEVQLRQFERRSNLDQYCPAGLSANICCKDLRKSGLVSLTVSLQLNRFHASSASGSDSTVRKHVLVMVSIVGKSSCRS